MDERSRLSRWEVGWKVQEVVAEKKENSSKGSNESEEPFTKPRKLESGSWPAGLRDDQHRKSSAKLLASVIIDRGWTRRGVEAQVVAAWGRDTVAGLQLLFERVDLGA